MFMQLESLLVARLRETCPAAKFVLLADDLDDVTKMSQRTPALHVLYGGYRLLDEGSNGKAAAIEQTWLIVCAARSAQQREGTTEKRIRAAELVDQALPALLGWKPLERGAPMHLAPAPKPLYSDGCTYLPLAFTWKLNVQANNQL